MQLPKMFAVLSHPYSWQHEDAYEHAAILYLISRGYTAWQSACITANYTQESGMNPRARRRNDAGPGQDAVGIEQDNAGRLRGLETFVAKLTGKPFDALADPDLLYAEIAYTLHELATTEVKSAHVLRDNRDARNLASLFGRSFERYSASSSDARDTKAGEIMARFEAA